MTFKTQLILLLMTLVLWYLYKRVLRTLEMDTDSQISLPDRSAINTELQLPGLGLPVGHLPKWNRDASKSERFPHAIADFFAGEGVSVREQRMLDFINKISDKPDWERKVFDEEILSRWLAEASEHDKELNDVILSEKMFEYCVKELREKAEVFKKTGIMAVLDAEATVVKSDTAIPPELKESLIKHVHPLEDVPEKQKDWHPGSDNKVLDLLHPSLFPFVYGLSKVLPQGNVPLANCISYSGMGDQIPVPDDVSVAFQRSKSWGNGDNLRAWGSYQWLPSDVKFNRKGSAEITSYINNLHPRKHAELYKVLEQFVDCAIPLWNETLSWFHSRIRIPIDSKGDDDYVLPRGLRYLRPGDRSNNENNTASDNVEFAENAEGGDNDSGEDTDEDLRWDDGYRDWIEEHRILIQPEPKEFEPFADSIKEACGASPIDLREKFASSGLQIIFKLANIHLTPEKPNYEGGSWHVEGALNEHICATALYYYDQENVTESHLAFRQSIDAEEMTMKPPQNEWSSLEEYYGIQNEEAALQVLGKVNTRPDRLLAFPNVIQHAVQPFSLADPTKPGHRKILAMFLVDPHVRVISTGNVPPQRRDWWAEEVRKVTHFEKLPQEVFDKIIEVVDDFPISWESAVEIRQSLMDERGALTDAFNTALEEDTFYFCEH
ncbi:hypothetical protein B0O99DRAFT_686151 [Bisporella sp. PMI_857]|nr:hypothetical protein B0O99DRAFT_686151 [Bisporella sp. PMI_857]